MANEVEVLVGRFHRANLAAIATITGCTEEQLLLACPVERCTVAALACHVADRNAVGAEWVRMILAGEPLPPLTRDLVEQVDALGFTRNAYRPKRDVLERLRRSGAEAAAVLGQLHDADWDRRSPFTLFGGPTVSIRELVTAMLIEEPESHLRSIRAAIAAGTAIT